MLFKDILYLEYVFCLKSFLFKLSQNDNISKSWLAFLWTTFVLVSHLKEKCRYEILAYNTCWYEKTIQEWFWCLTKTFSERRGRGCACWLVVVTWFQLIKWDIYKQTKEDLCNVYYYSLEKLGSAIS